MTVFYIHYKSDGSASDSYSVSIYREMSICIILWIRKIDLLKVWRIITKKFHKLNNPNTLLECRITTLKGAFFLPPISQWSCVQIQNLVFYHSSKEVTFLSMCINMYQYYTTTCYLMHYQNKTKNIKTTILPQRQKNLKFWPWAFHLVLHF